MFVGCSNDDGSDNDAHRTETAEAPATPATGTIDDLEPPVFVDASDPHGMVAGLGGSQASVFISDRGCFLLHDDDMNEEALIIWPAATVRDEDIQDAVVVPGIGKVGAGTKLNPDSYGQITEGPSGNMTIRDVRDDYPGIEECGSETAPVRILTVMY